MASRLPFPYNLSEDKHVESSSVPRLDEGSIPSSSTQKDTPSMFTSIGGAFFKSMGLLVKLVDKIGAVFVYWSKIVDKCGCIPAFSTCI